MMRRLGLKLLWQSLHQHLEQKQHSQPIIKRWILYETRSEQNKFTTRLFYTLHLSFLFLQILRTFLTRFVYSSNKSLDVSFMPKAIFVLLPRRSIVCNINIAVLAKIFFFDIMDEHWWNVVVEVTLLLILSYLGQFTYVFRTLIYWYHLPLW